MIPRPGKIVCVGLNYKAHVDEGVYDLPDYPALFPKFADTLVGAGEPIVLPPESEAVDFEAELAFVIGTPGGASPGGGAGRGRRLRSPTASRCATTSTSRTEWLAGKAWARSTPLGPFLVTPDEVGDPHALDISLELNAERMQEANTRLFIFDIPTIVATILEFTAAGARRRGADRDAGGGRLPARPEGPAARRRLSWSRSRTSAARDHRRRHDPSASPSTTSGRRATSSGWWPEDEPLGAHYSVTEALPRTRALDDAGLRATFFVEGSTPSSTRTRCASSGSAGHEVACHGWRHERWAALDPATGRDRLRRSVEGMRRWASSPAGSAPGR